jgi:hypothetical protein
MADEQPTIIYLTCLLKPSYPACWRAFSRAWITLSSPIVSSSSLDASCRIGFDLVATCCQLGIVESGIMEEIIDGLN